MIHRYYDPLQSRYVVEINQQNYICDYFKAIELGCPCCGKVRMARGFAEQLVVLRRIHDAPLILNSACRCDKHNHDVSGHPSSSHICSKPTKHTETVDYGCCGIDVANPPDRLIRIAIALGWSVGISQTFAHFDRVADYSLLKNYQRLFFYPAVSLGPREYWNRVYPEIQNARKTLGDMSWDS